MITESKLKEGVLTLGPSDAPVVTISCQATAVSLEPDFEENGEAVEVLCGDSLSAATKTSWTLKFTGIQDWTDKAGFINFAFDHDGEQVEFTWTPNRVGPTYTGTVIVQALVIGGDVNTRNTSPAEWPVQGKPLRTDPPPPEDQGPAAGTSESPTADRAGSPKGSK